MKKWTLAGLGTVSMFVWVAVILFFMTDNDLYRAGDHSLSLPSHSNVKSIDQDSLTSHFNRSGDGNAPEKAETIIGNQVISNQWIQDMSKDGKLSIDTLLETLNLNDS